jgi:competence protein ComEC
MFSRERWPGRVVRPFEDVFLMSVAVNAMVLPLTIYIFHGFSAAGFVANIVLVPLVGWVVLPLGLASLAIYAISASAALPVLKLAGLSIWICKAVIAWFSSCSWAFFWVGTLSLVTLASFYACIFLILGSWRWNLKGPCIGAVVVLGLVISFFPRGNGAGGEPSLRVDVIDVGQGSSTLIRFPTGETMLVDGGGFNDDAYDIGRQVLAPTLWQAGIRKIDTVVLSHDHPDHRNGLRFIVSHFDVGSLWESGIAAQGMTRSDLALIADRRNIPVRQVPQIIGERMVGDCSVRVLHPTSTYIEGPWERENLNTVSIVMEIRFRSTRVIIPGDIETPLEEILFTDAPVFDGETLLISPHHGSKQSNPPLLLDRLQPKTVIFSCGADNVFRFPHERVLEECERRNIRVLRTDLEGAIRAVSNGLGWELEGYTDAFREKKGGDISPDVTASGNPQPYMPE